LNFAIGRVRDSGWVGSATNSHTHKVYSCFYAQRMITSLFHSFFSFLSSLFSTCVMITSVSFFVFLLSFSVFNDRLCLIFMSLFSVCVSVFSCSSFSHTSSRRNYLRYSFSSEYYMCLYFLSCLSVSSFFCMCVFSSVFKIFFLCLSHRRFPFAQRIEQHAIMNKDPHFSFFLFLFSISHSLTGHKYSCFNIKHRSLRII